MRNQLSVERFTVVSASIGGLLVMAALVQNQLAPGEGYGLASFQENSVVFGWTASYALLALLSLTVRTKSIRGSLLGGIAVGIALAAVLLNGAKASALAVLLAGLVSSPVLYAAWSIRPRRLSRGRAAALGVALGVALAIIPLTLPADLTLPVSIGNPFSQGNAEGTSQRNAASTSGNSGEVRSSDIAAPIAKQVVSNSVIGRTAHASTDKSLGIRQLAWSVAVGDFETSPLLGHGTGSFHAEGIFSEYEYRWSVDYPHSIALEAAAETGIIGLVLLVAACIAALKTVWAASSCAPSSPASFFLLSGFVFSVVVTQFSGDLQMNRAIWIFAGISWGLAAHKIRGTK